MMERHLCLVVFLAAAAAACESTPAPSGASSGATATATPAPSASGGPAASGSSAAASLPPAPALPEDPPFFLPIPSPEENKLTAEKVELGKMLFFDKRMGQDDKWSCESCHYADKGWADGEKLSVKADGKANTRHSPTLFNVAYAREWYWDGRMKTLEAQILAAWKGQMGADPAAVATKLEAIPAYASRFRRAFGGEANEERIVHALASFVRTLRAGPTPWDLYENGDKTAVGEDAVRGFDVFTKKANCSLCHTPPLYADFQYRNVGIGFQAGATEPDLGRGAITKDEKDNGKFKTPSLRGAALHPPYFHDGSAATLEEAVDYMLSGGHQNPQLDQQMKKIELSADERKDLIAFIVALSPKDYKLDTPELP